MKSRAKIQNFHADPKNPHNFNNIWDIYIWITITIEAGHS